jgi:hypothetical protein
MAAKKKITPKSVLKAGLPKRSVAKTKTSMKPGNKTKQNKDEPKQAWERGESIECAENE